jgi:hypothetical protein
MEAILALSSVPSLLEPNQKFSEIIKKLQRLIDIVLKNRVTDKAVSQIILITECIRIWAFIKETKVDQNEFLSDNVPDLKDFFRSISRIFRPYVYLLGMMLWGRNSKIALAACIVLDLLSDARAWETYLLRYPIFDKLILKLTPKILRPTVESYQGYITYII